MSRLARSAVPGWTSFQVLERLDHPAPEMYCLEAMEKSQN